MRILARNGDCFSILLVVQALDRGHFISKSCTCLALNGALHKALPAARCTVIAYTLFNEGSASADQISGFALQSLQCNASGLLNQGRR